MLDVFSRYSVACVRRSKKPQSMTNAILKTWISYFGHSKWFLADNVGEFSNDEYKQMCELFNIDVSKTAAESPCSCGLCERHNGVIKESVKKVVEDVKCSLETADAWAVSAKNSLHSDNGCSPNHIVFGRNTDMPSVLKDKLPALHGEVSSITVENNLKAMHKALEAFVKCESSERIKRALNHNIRSCNDASFYTGDHVYYKRENNSKWRRPRTVFGQNHKQVFVRHGSELVRVHSS